MKKLLLACFLMMGMINASTAQIKTPAPSPAAKIMQTVGITDLEVEYSRPSMKGRTIFAADGLVPFGKLWRTGANAATKFTTSSDIMVGGKELKKGEYAILTIPEAGKWTINFYPYESWSWGSYVEATPAASVMSDVMKTNEKMESFMIAFDELTNEGANMYFLWENTVVPVSISANDQDAIEKSIETTLAGPSANDYYSAASYYYDEGKNLKTALEWISKATDVANPKFWQLRKKSLIQAKLGMKSEAVKTAKESLRLAKEAGNADYVKMNEDSIKAWSR